MSERQDRLSRIEHHLATLNDEMGEARDAIVELQTDMGWLKKILWLAAGSSIGGLVTGIINLL